MRTRTTKRAGQRDQWGRIGMTGASRAPPAYVGPSRPTPHGLTGSVPPDGAVGRNFQPAPPMAPGRTDACAGGGRTMAGATTALRPFDRTTPAFSGTDV